MADKTRAAIELEITEAREEIARRRAGWTRLQAWLRTSDAGSFMDDAVMGCLPAYEAGELLEDYGLEDTAENRRRLGRELDAALTAGEA